jgi:hypothetical protein
MLGEDHRIHYLSPIAYFVLTENMCSAAGKSSITRQERKGQATKGAESG